MLNKIIAYSVRNKLIVGILVIAMAGWGIYNVTRLPIDAVPDITNNQVLVITSSPSLGAADIERQITFPIENATRNIPGIIEQRSFSRFGLSIITIVFDDRTDVYWARQQVSGRLSEIQSQIPPSLGTPVLGPVTTGLGEIFQYVVRPKPGYEGKYDATELRTIQDWIVRRQLLGTPGVADISSFGGKLKQYEIAVDGDKLKSHGITIVEVLDALKRNNQNTGGAYIEKGPAVLFIRSEGLVKSKEDIGNIVVRRVGNGAPLLIRDLSEVVIGSATRYGAMCFNDNGEVAGAVVMMLKGENSSAVIKNVKLKIAEIEKTLPEGVLIEPFLDRTKMVNNAISTVRQNLLEGALIVLFVLVIFLGNLRAGLLVASIIPLAMLFAISMMNLFGVSGNLMSLGALDFGLIVDGAVIIVEATMHLLHRSPGSGVAGLLSRKQMNEVVIVSSSKLMNAAVFGQVIILIVYFPILSLQGIEGKMFRPMAETVIFAIIGAFVLSLTYVPMMSSLVLSRRLLTKPTLADRMMRKAENSYRHLLDLALRIPRIVTGISALILLIAILVLMRLGGEFIPQLEEGDFAVDTRVLTGSSLATTIRSTQQAAHILLQTFPEVQKVVTKIGSGEIPTDPMSMEASDMMVILAPKNKWTSAKSFDELAEKMSRSLEDVPGITAGFQFPVQMRFNELMTGGRQDVICKIFGENLDSLDRYAHQVGEIARKIEGAKDLYVESQTGMPQIVVDYNRNALAQFGVAVEDVNAAVQAAFAGSVAGQVYENERRYDLVVRLSSEKRSELSDVQNLLIPVSDGSQVPLQQLADVSIKVGPGQIQREDAQRRITVGFNVRGKDVQTVMQELQGTLASQLKLPAGYHISYGGDFENLLAAKKRLSIAVPISLLLIFVLLYFAFHSISESLLIFTAIPLSAVGGIFSLELRSLPFSISAGVGFIALFGIAVLNGIVLLTEFNELEKNGVTDILTRVRQGTQNRLRPVLMTASVASLGFLPMAMSNGAGAEVQRPLATVVIGGLISATLLTLILLPALYLLIKRAASKKAMKRVLPLLILPLLFMSPGLSAQQNRLSLPEAINLALKQNRSVQVAGLQRAAQKAIERTATEIPNTFLQAEWGKVNSAASDTKFTASQSFAFPVVYRRQREVFQAQTRSSFLSENALRQQVKIQVSTVFYEMAVMMEKQSLLKKVDSLYAAVLERQEQRFKAGDANITEKTSAEIQRMQAANQLAQVNADLSILQVRFSYLLNLEELLLPMPGEAKSALVNMPDTSMLKDLPSMQSLFQQQQILGAELKLLKVKKLPLITAGYNNQSFVGIQNLNGTDRYFGSGSRFSSLFAGFSVSIFGRYQQARINAVKLHLIATTADFEDSLAMQKSLLRERLLAYEKSRRVLAYYEGTGLRQSELLFSTAGQQLNNGQINFMEWMLLTNQATALQSAYLDALADWNRVVIGLNNYSLK